MLVSLSEASRLTGKSKSVISNALKKGVMSYVSKDLTGYKIDTSELFRVFSQRTEEPVLEPLERTIQNPSKNDHENEILELKVRHLEEKLKMVEKEIEYLRLDKDQWQRQASQLLLSPPQHSREANFRRTLIDRALSK
jgi:hypothetical protein